MIAFIASRISMARVDYELVKMTLDNRGVIRLNGIEVPFIIVTEPDQSFHHSGKMR